MQKDTLICTGYPLINKDKQPPCSNATQRANHLLSLPASVHTLFVQGTNDDFLGHPKKDMNNLKQSWRAWPGRRPCTRCRAALMMSRRWEKSRGGGRREGRDREDCELHPAEALSELERGRGSASGRTVCSVLDTTVSCVQERADLGIIQNLSLRHAARTRPLAHTRFVMTSVFTTPRAAPSSW